MEETKNTVSMFDASLQRDAEHTVDIDQNGEIVLTSVESGRFTKLPAGTNGEALKAYVEAHKLGNEGQITIEALEAQKAKLLAELGL